MRRISFVVFQLALFPFYPELHNSLGNQEASFMANIILATPGCRSIRLDIIPSPIPREESSFYLFGNSLEDLTRKAVFILSEFEFTSNCSKIFEEITSKFILQGQYYPDTKIVGHIRKENYQPISLMNIKCKIPQQNISKPTCIVHSKDRTPWSRGLYSRDVRMVHHTQSINVILHINKVKDKNQMIIWVGTGKAFNKVQYPIKVKTQQTD